MESPEPGSDKPPPKIHGFLCLLHNWVCSLFACNMGPAGSYPPPVFIKCWVVNPVIPGGHLSNTEPGSKTLV